MEFSADNEPLLSEENPAEEDSSGIMPTVEAKKAPAIGFFKALFLPGVIPVSVSTLRREQNDLHFVNDIFKSTAQSKTAVTPVH